MGVSDIFDEAARRGGRHRRTPGGTRSGTGGSASRLLRPTAWPSVGGNRICAIRADKRRRPSAVHAAGMARRGPAVDGANHFRSRFDRCQVLGRPMELSSRNSRWHRQPGRRRRQGRQDHSRWRSWFAASSRTYVVGCQSSADADAGASIANAARRDFSHLSADRMPLSERRISLVSQWLAICRIFRICRKECAGAPCCRRGAPVCANHFNSRPVRRQVLVGAVNSSSRNLRYHVEDGASVPSAIRQQVGARRFAPIISASGRCAGKCLSVLPIEFAQFALADGGRPSAVQAAGIARRGVSPIAQTIFRNRARHRQVLVTAAQSSLRISRYHLVARLTPGVP